MRNIIINNLLKYIKNNTNDITNEKLEIIEYGLVSIYLLISKFIVMIILAAFLGIIKELLLFILFYSIIRIPSFGLHATKSWICLILSTIIFFGCTFICLKLTIPIYFKITFGTIFSLLIFKNSPADTHKRPIVNPKRRKFFKIISTTISIMFVFFSIIIKDNFISNCLIISVGCQTIFISPMIYKIFNLPYNNYKNYNLEVNN